MQVSELMCSKPLTCRPWDGLDYPARLMWDHDIGSVPVVDDHGHAIGIITDRDIAMAAFLNNVALSTLRVENTMSHSLVSVLPTDSLGHAEQLMCLHQVRRLPVVDNFGKLLGLLTQHDLVREAVNESKSRGKELVEHDVLRTLHAIGAPRGLAPTALVS